MVYVNQGKLVIGYSVYSYGDLIEGLSPEDEERLIASGLCVRRIDERQPEAEKPAITSFVVTDEDDQEPGETAESAKEPSKAELQERCRELGLSTRGTKDTLKARLDEYAAADEDETDEGEDEPPALSAEVPQ